MAFFLVGELFLSVEVIEEERKASKRQSSSDEESRKKGHRELLWSTRVHEYGRSNVGQTAGWDCRGEKLRSFDTALTHKLCDLAGEAQ